jgi:MFS family permease
MNDARGPAAIWRVSMAGLVGTAIEWYDLFIFGTAAALVFGQVFFPALSSTAGLLASFATFAVSFIARPLGGIFFGHFGDRVGRKKMLVASLLLMGVATVLIGVLPGYGAIGLTAPILLVILRFAQGIGLGGEFGGAMLMVGEHAPPRRRGFFIGLAQLGPSIGLVLGSLTFLVLSLNMDKAQMASWGWRIPFVVSGLLVGLGLYIRLRLVESTVFQEVLQRQAQVRVPLFEVVRTAPLRLVLACGPSLLTSALFYLISTFSLSYGVQTLKIPQPTMLVVVIGIVVFNAVITTPLSSLSDRIGRRRMLILGSLAAAVWAFPMFALANTGTIAGVVVGLGIGLVTFSMMWGPLGAYLPELFGTRVRFTGTSVSFNIGALLGGALAPIIATSLLSWTGGSWWSLSSYVLVISVIALGCVLALPETHRADLADAELSGHGAADAPEDTRAGSAHDVPVTGTKGAS